MTIAASKAVARPTQRQGNMQAARQLFET